MAERIDWKNSPVVTVVVELPLCPECHAGKPIHIRGSKGNGELDSIEQVICRRCQLPFGVERIFRIAELANSTTGAA